MIKNDYTSIISQSIGEIVLIADKLPGVVIIHDLRDWSVAWMSKRGLDLLGITLSEVTTITSAEYFARYFNSEDTNESVPKILGLLQKNNDGDFCTYFQQVRFSIPDDYNWYMNGCKILANDNEGKPLLTITLALPIDAMHHMTTKASRLLEENNFLRRNFQLFSSLSKRECTVLKLLALGKSSTETANELFIAIGTVETHRKNIRRKLKTSDYYELCQFARAFDLI
ncbi:helix-turn-helix transcriptional regulator [Mucilaginibacter psychrotolerans]|uniref:LuxR family transcriptional regulator n=1 Tax=Mucilaginibacter psychrotolerans TaxID=1524096 RepID=A0A4Y8S434_9SPHI|nr:helix-turn-helix transcriptional regulator [Mucilaginibacter psychrotolerans]TFF33441.1 LuxR family transcriptional regulator [Mucilaginibacter psychrotolerans]